MWVPVFTKIRLPTNLINPEFTKLRIYLKKKNIFEKKFSIKITSKLLLSSSTIANTNTFL